MSDVSENPKILFFDIETINLKADLSPILCMAWKFWGDKKVECLGLWDFPLFDKRPYDDTLLCKKIYEVMCSADAYCAHYGTRFDLKFIKTRLAFHRMPPPPKVKLIDTWRLAKDNLALTSNRLKNLCAFFQLKEQKMDSGGWQTWLDVINKDKKAIQKMVKYNKQDVLALEGLYKVLRPYANNIPNYSLFKNSSVVCRNCGSKLITYRGYYRTTARMYRRYQCSDCGTWGHITRPNHGSTTVG